MLENIRSLSANYDELIKNVKNIFIKAPFIALSETWLKRKSILSTFCQDEHKYILTCSGQRGKSRRVAIMCRENTRMPTFKESNIPELRILTVKTALSGQIMFITVVYKALQLRNLTFQDKLMTHLIETGNHVMPIT